MMRQRLAGFTVVEMLIALVIIAVAFSALAVTQVSNLRASSRSRFLSDDKAAANQVLEQTMAKILKVDTTGINGSSFDDDPTSAYRSFYFIDYYYRCPTTETPQGVRDGSTSNLRLAINDEGSPTNAVIACKGSQTITTDTGPVFVKFGVDGEGGTLGEGDILVWARAHHVNGSGNDSITLANRITCYDVYPSPSADAPEPCPNPPVSGTAGGRP